MAHQADGRLGGRAAGVLWAALVVAGGAWGAWGDDGATNPAAPDTVQLEARIAELIEQLGAPEYATRQRAQAELQRLQLDAFDALNEAQDSDDIEIAMSARYLVRTMQVTWASDDDPPAVRQQLQGYGDRPESDRRSQVDQLALLGGEQALRPLCRVARYEASEKLSKHTALLIMGLAVPPDAADLQEFSQSLLKYMGTSRRTAAHWLRAYVAVLQQDPAAADRWRALVDREQACLVDSSDQTSREITRDLLKWYADQLARWKKPDESRSVMRAMTGLLNNTPLEVLDAVDWFRDRQSWQIVTEIAAQFPETFRRSPLLLYRLADAYRHMGDQQQADKTAQQALEATPDELERHIEMAAHLEQDGLFDSAELEYRHVAKAINTEPLSAIRAKYYLAELLFDQHKSQAAGDVLKEVIDSVTGSQDLQMLVEEELGRELASTRSRMLFFYADHEAQQGHVARQRELLLEGYQHDPFDIELLIAMYQLPQADEAWRNETRARVNAALEDYRRQIRELHGGDNVPRAAAARGQFDRELALLNNNLAWLAANAGGDPDEAIRCSLESLRLFENHPTFLDTLARAYYAKGEFASAVKFQTQAVAAKPHSPTMRAQLELFQQALAERESAKIPGGGPPQPP